MHQPFSPCRPPKPPQGLIARLDAKVDRSGGPEACWPWRASLARGQKRETGYPILQRGGKRSGFWRVNRLVLLLQEIPEEAFEDERSLLYWLRLANDFRSALEAAHGCDNARCCNPAHLEWAEHGKQVSEQAERRARGRGQEAAA